MKAATLELEGSWEEVLARASEWVGRRVRLTVLPDESSEADASEGLAEPFWTASDPAEVFEEQGIQPVTDVDAFIASLPRPGGVEALWDAISADRAERRAEDGPSC